MTLLEKEEITPDTLGLLMFVKLNSSPTAYVQDMIKQYLFDFQIPDTDYNLAEVFEAKGLIKYVKTGRKDPWYRIRLSEKGDKILKDLNKKPQHELAEMMLEFIQSEYRRIGAEALVRGGDKLLNRISEFLYFKEAYTEKMIKAVIRAYVSQFEYEKTYMNNMETLIFKPANVYTTKWTAEESPLCKFIDKSQDKIKYEYSRL